MSDIKLTTPEKYALIGALCDKLKWLYGYGCNRAEHMETAGRLLELTESLPDDAPDGA
jgi:hypothetical protein